MLYSSQRATACPGSSDSLNNPIKQVVQVLTAAAAFCFSEMLSSSTVCLSWFGEHEWRVRLVLGAGGGRDAEAQRRTQRKQR